jgi:hypothetical protein
MVQSATEIRGLHCQARWPKGFCKTGVSTEMQSSLMFHSLRSRSCLLLFHHRIPCSCGQCAQVGWKLVAVVVDDSKMQRCQWIDIFTTVSRRKPADADKFNIVVQACKDGRACQSRAHLPRINQKALRVAQAIAQAKSSLHKHISQDGARIQVLLCAPI